MRRALSLAAATLLAFAASAAPRIEPGPLEPFNLASAALRVEEAYPGGLELHGILSDGSRNRLFAAKSPAWRASVEARFFVPDGLEALELVEAASGELLARLEAPAAALDAESRDARRKLRLLSFPLRGPGGGKPADSLGLSRADPAAAARAASSGLFVPPRRPAALAVLAAWVLLVLVVAAFSGRSSWAPLPGRRALLGLSIACLLAAGLAATLGRPGAARWELGLPAEGPPWNFEARLVEDSESEGVRILRWAPDPLGPLAFLAFHDPIGRGVPLGDWAHGRLRFSRPPLVEFGTDGVFRMESRRFLMAWRLDDAR